MSHHLYHTEAIVLKTRNIGESSKLVYLLTKDLGLLVAKAQGVRKINAKLKFGLQEFSVSNVTLVRGKEFWKVIGSEKMHAFAHVVRRKGEHRLAARFAALVLRLVNGEEPHPELFVLLHNMFTFLDGEKLDNHELALTEVAGVLAILRALGYLEHELLPEAIYRGEEWTKALLPLIAQIKDDAILAINQSFEQSHL